MKDMLLILCLVLPFRAAAQSWVQPVNSPVVHSDRTVTFYYQSRGAKKVELTGQFMRGNQPLQADTNGLWSVTVGPVEPDLYPYHFNVDGVAVSDPNNEDIFPNERFKGSLLDVPGKPPSLHAIQDVPHGDVIYCTYKSEKFGPRPLIVYTPPGYRAGTNRYPVLYLVSGTTDTEETWFKVGRVNVILDNLIAQQKAVPMIVVMPYGNMGNTPAPTSPQAAEMYQIFSRELTGSILPYVEANYRVVAQPEQRAIAGFSRGGGQSLFTGFSNLDKFAWIGSYSAYLTPEVFAKHFPSLVAEPGMANNKLRLLWLGVGREDFLYQQAVEFDAFLREKKVAHQIRITGGGHTWMNARDYLAETVQMYFR